MTKSISQSGFTHSLKLTVTKGTLKIPLQKLEIVWNYFNLQLICIQPRGDRGSFQVIWYTVNIYLVVGGVKVVVGGRGDSRKEWRGIMLNFTIRHTVHVKVNIWISYMYDWHTIWADLTIWYDYGSWIVPSSCNSFDL